MNLKLKTLVAAVAMVAAGAAQAAIYTDNYNGFNGITTGTGDGEIFLAVYDPSVEKSLVLDLNLTVNDFRYNNASLINSFSVTDPTLQSFITASSDQSQMQWNMGGLSNMGIGPDLGFVTTHGNLYGAGPTIETGALEGPFDGGGLTAGMTNMEAFVGANPTTAVVDGLSAGGWSGGLWGGTYGGMLFFQNYHVGFEGGELMSFIYADENDTLYGTPFAQTFANAEWVINPATGSVAYVSAVPVPAAVWLFASGLLGLVGIARRRKQS